MVLTCIPSNNLTLVCIWAHVCTWIRGKGVPFLLKTFFFGLYLNSGKKSVPFLVKTFFFWSHLKSGKKVFQFWWRLFFLLVSTWIRGKKCSISGEDLFFLVYTWIRGKKVFHFWWSLFFFGLHLICSSKKSLGRGSSPSMLKIGKFWGKIANFSPQCSTKICTTAKDVLEDFTSDL